MAWSESDLVKIAGPRATFVGAADLPALWAAGERVYGITDEPGGGIVKVTPYSVERYGMPDHLWVSGVTVADMIKEA